jgi:hypothetical protein
VHETPILDLVPRIPGITIFIKTPGGIHLTLAVASTALVESVKSRIQYQLRIPCDEQRLSLRGQELKDDHALEEYPIRDLSVVDLSLSPLNTIPIMIRLPDGNMIPVNVGANGRVDHIKGHLEVTRGLVRDDQTLVLNDRTLNDEDSLEDCSVTAGAIADLIYGSGAEMAGLIEIPGRESVFIGGRPTDTAGNLKCAIMHKTGIPRSQQELKYDGMTLKDGDTLQEFVTLCAWHSQRAQLELRPNGLMRVFVKTPDGSLMSFDCRQTESIGDIRTRLEIEHGIPLVQQVLTYKKQSLVDGVTLCGASLPIWPTLELNLQLPGLMRIFLRMPDGSKMTLDCLPSDRIEAVKATIEREKGVPRGQQLLTFRARWMGDSQTLEECTVPGEFEKPTAVLWPTLDLLVCPPGHLPILIKCLYRSPFTRVVALTDSVCRIVRGIETEFEIPREYSRFQHINMMLVSSWSGNCPNPDWKSLDRVACRDDSVPIFVQLNDAGPVTVVVPVIDSLQNVMTRLGAHTN